LAKPWPCKLWTVDEVAEYLNVNPQSVRNYIDRNTLRPPFGHPDMTTALRGQERRRAPLLVAEVVA
jgi:hypothetical protein